MVLQGILSVFLLSKFIPCLFSVFNKFCFLVLLLFYCPRGCNRVDINLLSSFFLMVHTLAQCNNVGLAVVQIFV